MSPTTSSRARRSWPLRWGTAFTVSLLVGCAHPADDAVTARHTLDSLQVAIERWYTGGHGDSMAALYGPDAAIFLPNRPPVQGADAIAAHWQGMFAGYAREVDLATQSLVVQGPVAVEHGRYEMIMTREGETTALATDRGHYIMTWQRTPLGWRARYDISVSEVARARS